MQLKYFAPAILSLSQVQATPTPHDVETSALESRASDSIHVKWCIDKEFKGKCQSFWTNKNLQRCEPVASDFHDKISSIDLRSPDGSDPGGYCAFYEHGDCNTKKKGYTLNIGGGGYVNRMDDPFYYVINDKISSFDCFTGGVPQGKHLS